MWTDRQLEAITGDSKKRLVAASAGTGKTSVLVERIRTLLARGAHIDRMLIVTFTNAAAAEMRDRISAALQADGLSGELLRMPGAQISTLHSFCVDLLRRHFEAAGIDPAFRLCDATERSVLSERAMEAAMDELYENSGEEFMALDAWFGPHDAIAEWALAVYSHILAREDPWEWLDRAIDMYDGSLKPWLAELTHMANARLGDMIEIAVKAREDPYIATIEADVAVIEKYKSVLEKDGILALPDALDSIEFPRMPPLRNVEADIKARVSAARDRVKKGKKALCEALYPLRAGDADLLALRAPLSGLATLVRAYHTRFMEQKAERNALDFTDLEHLALRALSDPEVAKAASERFDHIFVDEYQDVSRVQEAILNAVCGDNTLFLVGDVKQSIYRFRLADPTLFIEKFHSYSMPGDTVRIDLTENFRSRGNILRAVNAIFAGVMTSEAAEIDYDESAALVQGTLHSGDDPAVQVCLIDEKEWESGEVSEAGEAEEAEERPDSSGYFTSSDSTDSFERSERSEKNPELDRLGRNPFQDEAEPDPADLLAAEREAMACAEYISAIMSERLYDAKAEKYRPYTYHDIVILLRSVRGTAQLYADTLQSVGIPAYADVSTGFFDVPEVRVTLDILKTLHNRQRDIPLLSAIRAIARLDGPELARIRLLHNEPNASFYEAAVYCSRLDDSGEGGEDGLCARLKRFFLMLDEMRDRAAYSAMAALVWHVYDITGWYDYVGAWPLGTARKANLRALASHAETFDAGQGGGLYEFLQYLDQLENGGESSAAAMFTQSEQAVRIMSVHKSKGLEFPAVIVGGLGRSFNFRQKTYLMHDALGLAPPFVDPIAHIKRQTPARAAVLWRQKREYIAEEMRILYVALTRACDRLVLICGVRDMQKKLDAWSMRQTPGQALFAGCFFDWIGPMFYEELHNEILDNDDRFSGGRDKDASCYAVKGDASFELRVMSPRTASVTQAVMGVEEALSFASHPDWIDKRLSWRYPHEKPHLPSKLSVTGLVRLGEGITSEHRIPELRQRPRFLADEKPGPVEFGLAVHAALQTIELTRLRMAGVRLADEIKSQVVNSGDLSIKRISDNDTEDLVRLLEGFYSSEIGKRLLRSELVMREQPFNLSVDAESLEGIIDIDGQSSRILVQGIIDCCFLEPGGWVLLDYKTDRRPTPEIEARHKRQVKLYARAVEEILNEPVKEYQICYLNSQ